MADALAANGSVIQVSIERSLSEMNTNITVDNYFFETHCFLLRLILPGLQVVGE